MRSYSVLIALPAACGVLRESQISQVSPETLGKQLALHQKEHVVDWRWSSNRFYLAHTIGTERIESNAILFGEQLFCQSGTEEYHLLPG